MERTNLFVRIIFSSLPFIAVASIAIGGTFVAAQQVYRSSGNDPQIQMATDAASALIKGATLSSVLPQQSVTIESMLTPYVVIYDASGKPVAGSGSLHGQVPVLPDGVLQAALAVGRSEITWQPEEGIRQAIVIVPYSTENTSGFVMAGRSLAPTEERIADLWFMAAVALLSSLIAIVSTVTLREWLIK